MSLPTDRRPILPPSRGLRRRQALGLAAALLSETVRATNGPPAGEPVATGGTPPRGRILLTVQVGEGPGRREEQFDLQRLEALPQHAFTTQTPWYAGPRRFSGPLLRDVLAAARAQGTQITATALNDYKADIPFEDAQRHKMLVATRLEGKPMAVRDKGPLFIVYPYDESADLRSERYYSRSVWQLRALSVR